MKIFLSILLLIITITHIIPVNDIMNESNCIIVVDIDEEKDTDTKKEKQKEFFIFENQIVNADLKYKSTHHFDVFGSSLLLQKVETPPPNTI